jgi:hypothetical protein
LDFFSLVAIVSNIAILSKGHLWSWQNLRPKVTFAGALILPFGIFILTLSLSQGYQTLKARADFGVGLLPEVEGSAKFFKAQQIAGPIFNDYDIGGYLIFNLYPKKVFVDNRPEAYTQEFFEKVYKPMQENESEWQKQDAKYNFNAIFFSHRDYTPWAQTFLIHRVQDPAWAPVFVDGYNIIFLKRNEQNSEIIKKYEIPKSRFGITQN